MLLQRRFGHSLAAFLACSCLLGASGLPSGAMAQTVAAVAATATPSNTKPLREPAQSGMPWASLTPAQRMALAPLAGTWNALNAPQQRKWLEVSRNYTALTPPDQAKMHGRMAQWVGLSARERAAARLNFAATTEIAKELSADEKKAKWQAYQALSPDERNKLAQQGSRPLVGAAPAARPVAAQKLATLPSPAGKASQPSILLSPAKATDQGRLDIARPLPAVPSEAASTAAAPPERVER